MDYKVIWTDEAIEDLRELTARIAANNPTAALKFGEKIIRRSMLLGQHPRLGRVMRQQEREILREMIVRPYRLIYEIDDHAATVRVRVLWHGARQEPDSLPEL
jgi:addiction module RelE/StbE family toxin